MADKLANVVKSPNDPREYRYNFPIATIICKYNGILIALVVFSKNLSS